MHELATNAAKHGALSVRSGRLSVAWTVDDAGALELLWKESGGPPVEQPKHRGFGSALIERALGWETGGDAHLSFDPEGVTCEISLPSAALQRTEPVLEGGAEVQAGPTPLLVGETPGLRILVVEDSALVVMLVEDILADLKWEMIGPASKVSEALVLARNEQFDAALLDVNLHGEMSWPVATILKERGIPFLFSTGYDGATILPKEFANEHIVNKPFKLADVQEGFQAILSPEACAD